MAKSRRREITIDIRPWIEDFGLDAKKLVEQIGEKEIIKRIGKKEIIKQIGKKEVIKQIGKKEVVAELEVDDILAGLAPAKRRELKRRLEAEFGKS